MPDPNAGYTFGDGDLAARRLALVAEVYEASSRALLAAAAPARCDVALDLGCGPGYTTRLVAEVCRPRRTIGVDASAAFVARAESRAGRARPAGEPPVAGVEFVVHDATALPLPGAPADLIHARLLLAHLPEPLAVVDRWRTQLRPGGALILDEVESIDAPPGVLADYLELVVAVVASGGGTMYAGRLIEPLGGRGVEVPVEAAVAARMFAMNLPTWRDRATARGLAGVAELDRLARGLDALTRTPETRAVRWVMRQVAVG